jgi:hypothetical protein
MSTISRIILATVVTLVVHVDNCFACPACKDSFTSAGSNGSTGDAYSWSILFMLGVPLTIVVVASIFIARRVRQHPNSLTS